MFHILQNVPDQIAEVYAAIPQALQPSVQFPGSVGSSGVVERTQYVARVRAV